MKLKEERTNEQPDQKLSIGELTRKHTTTNKPQSDRLTSQAQTFLLVLTTTVNKLKSPESVLAKGQH